MDKCIAQLWSLSTYKNKYFILQIKSIFVNVKLLENIRQF